MHGPGHSTVEIVYRYTRALYYIRLYALINDIIFFKVAYETPPRGRRGAYCGSILQLCILLNINQGTYTCRFQTPMVASMMFQIIKGISVHKTIDQQTCQMSSMSNDEYVKYCRICPGYYRHCRRTLVEVLCNSANVFVVKFTKFVDGWSSTPGELTINAPRPPQTPELLRDGRSGEEMGEDGRGGLLYFQSFASVIFTFCLGLEINSCPGYGPI